MQSAITRLETSALAVEKTLRQALRKLHELGHLPGEDSPDLLKFAVHSIDQLQVSIKEVKSKAEHLASIAPKRQPLEIGIHE